MAAQESYPQLGDQFLKLQYCIQLLTKYFHYKKKKRTFRLVLHFPVLDE